MKSLFDYSEFFKNYNKIMMNSIIAAFPLLLPFPSSWAEAQKTACRWGSFRVRVTVKHHKQKKK
jgi:hypothetical protein